MVLRAHLCCWKLPIVLAFGLVSAVAAHAQSSEFSNVPTPAQIFELASELETLSMSPGGGLLTPIPGKPAADTPIVVDAALARSRRVNVPLMILPIWLLPMRYGSELMAS